MLQRCRNKACKAYKNYGGRRITVCDKWLDFEKFYEDMGDAPNGMTLDRKDTNGPYCQENCRWATTKEQNRNKRNIRYLTIDGIQKSMVEWSEDCGIPLKTISWRISKGWSEKDAVRIPLITNRVGIKRGESLHKHAFGAERGVIFGDQACPA